MAQRKRQATQPPAPAGGRSSPIAELIDSVRGLTESLQAGGKEDKCGDDEVMSFEFNHTPYTEHPNHPQFTMKTGKLYIFLQSFEGMQAFKTAIRVQMRYRYKQYGKMKGEAAERVRVEEERIRGMRDYYEQQLVDGIDGKDETSQKAMKKEHSWQIYEAARKDGALENLQNEVVLAESKQKEARSILMKDNMEQSGKYDQSLDTSMNQRRDRLVEALEELACFNYQHKVVDKVVDIVFGFLQSPVSYQGKEMNFALYGPPGTGKTTIGKIVGKVFAHCGMFINSLGQTGTRNDLIASYQGQTSGKTLAWLTNGLDNGVSFLDEAYSLITWSEGNPDSYGSEAVAVMLDFMTKYPGQFCLMVAGYKKEMDRYFFSANPGLPRRFQIKFELDGYTTKEMILIYKRKLLERMNLNLDMCQKNTPTYADYMFTNGAWTLLERFIYNCNLGAFQKSKKENEYDGLTKRKFPTVREWVPQYPALYDFVIDQGAAMKDFSDETIDFVLASKDVADIKSTQPPQPSPQPSPQSIVDHSEDAEMVDESGVGGTTNMPVDAVDAVDAGAAGAAADTKLPTLDDIDEELQRAWDDRKDMVVAAMDHVKLQTIINLRMSRRGTYVNGVEAEVEVDRMLTSIWNQMNTAGSGVDVSTLSDATERDAGMYSTANDKPSKWSFAVPEEIESTKSGKGSDTKSAKSGAGSSNTDSSFNINSMQRFKVLLQYGERTPELWPTIPGMRKNAWVMQGPLTELSKNFINHENVDEVWRSVVLDGGINYVYRNHWGSDTSTLDMRQADNFMQQFKSDSQIAGYVSELQKRMMININAEAFSEGDYKNHANFTTDKFAFPVPFGQFPFIVDYFQAKAIDIEEELVRVSNAAAEPNNKLYQLAPTTWGTPGRVKYKPAATYKDESYRSYSKSEDQNPLLQGGICARIFDSPDHKKYMRQVGVHLDPRPYSGDAPPPGTDKSAWHKAIQGQIKVIELYVVLGAQQNIMVHIVIHKKVLSEVTRQYVTLSCYVARPGMQQHADFRWQNATHAYWSGIVPARACSENLMVAYPTGGLNIGKTNGNTKAEENKRDVVAQIGGLMACALYNIYMDAKMVRDVRFQESLYKESAELLGMNPDKIIEDAKAAAAAAATATAAAAASPPLPPNSPAVVQPTAQPPKDIRRSPRKP